MKLTRLRCHHGVAFLVPDLGARSFESCIECATQTSLSASYVDTFPRVIL